MEYNTVYEKRKECRKVYIEECKPSYNYKTKCKSVPHESCEYVNTPKMVPEKKCEYVSVPKCENVPKEHCSTYTVPKCKKVPEEVCHNEYMGKSNFRTSPLDGRWF